MRDAAKGRCAWRAWGSGGIAVDRIGAWNMLTADQQAEAMLAPLFSEMLGVQTAPIDYVEDGRRHRVRIGDEVDITVEDLVPPQTPEGPVEKLVGMFHPANRP
jgi:hypothetical protein